MITTRRLPSTVSILLTETDRVSTEHSVLVGASVVVVGANVVVVVVAGANVVVVVVVVGGEEIVRLCDVVADAPPLLLTVWPVKTCVVEVPAEFVTVRFAVKLPPEL